MFRTTRNARGMMNTALRSCHPVNSMDALRLRVRGTLDVLRAERWWFRLEESGGRTRLNASARCILFLKRRGRPYGPLVNGPRGRLP